jgi:uncharacterized membrane protein YfcA
VTVQLGAKLLKVTPKAVDLMLAQLGGALPRELTGRTRYRAWGCRVTRSNPPTRVQPTSRPATGYQRESLDGDRLLALFGLVMIVVGAVMLRRRGSGGNPEVRLTAGTARRLLPPLLGIGFGVGLFSGFFGIGGGFLIVPGLMLATGMPLTFAIGTSLVVVTAFGAATAASYALSGLVDWWLAGLFVLGGLLGGFAGAALGKRMAYIAELRKRIGRH